MAVKVHKTSYGKLIVISPRKKAKKKAKKSKSKIVDIGGKKRKLTVEPYKEPAKEEVSEEGSKGTPRELFEAKRREQIQKGKIIPKQSLLAESTQKQEQPTDFYYIETEAGQRIGVSKGIYERETSKEWQQAVAVAQIRQAVKQSQPPESQRGVLKQRYKRPSLYETAFKGTAKGTYTLDLSLIHI